MTIQTPEQIADHIAAVHDMSGPEAESMWRTAMIEAVNADRAQRASIPSDYRDDQENVRGSAYVDVKWSVFDEGERLSFESDMRLTPDEAVGMFQGIGEVAAAGAADRIAALTAAWEESTGDTASDYMLSEDDWKVGLDDEEAAEISRLIEWQEENK